MEKHKIYVELTFSFSILCISLQSVTVSTAVKGFEFKISYFNGILTNFENVLVELFQSSSFVQLYTLASGGFILKSYGSPWTLAFFRYLILLEYLLEL